MQKLLLSIGLLTATCGQSQTWTKISGILDSSQVKGIAINNNQIIAAGQNWISSSKTDYAVSNDGGNTWSKLPTFSYAGVYPIALPQNNLLLSSAFISTNKLVTNTWQNFSSSAFSFAEFNNGTIIGGNPYGTDTLYYFNTSGVKGAKLGNFKTRLGFKYFNNGANNRFFVCSTYFCYIDILNPTVKNIPATLDGVVMTETSWQQHNIINMVKTANGTLLAIDQLPYGMFKSTDNGANWTTVNTSTGTNYACSAIVKNANDEVFVLSGNAILKTTNYGVTFTNITGNLPTPGSFISEIFVNINNELFCITNANGSTDASKSGIYKLTNINSVNEIDKKMFASIYPNPTQNNFTVNATLNIDNIIVTDVLGKTVYASKPNTTSQTIDLSSQSDGMYFVNITSGNKNQTIKLIKN